MAGSFHNEDEAHTFNRKSTLKQKQNEHKDLDQLEFSLAISGESLEIILQDVSLL